jgi:hypothetical protein
MPSPFPGMDPYIEHPEVWSDFHGGLADEIRAELNRTIQPRYVARLVPRVTYELVEIEKPRSVRPDVGVWRPRSGSEGEGTSQTAVLSPPPAQSLIAMEAPLRLYTVEVVEAGELQLVTAIEVLSPVNKQPGREAHDEYLRKRRELLRSSAHLIEIDLLRAGRRPPLERPVPAAPYYVILSREERRPRVDVWPIQLGDKLPTIPIPLLEPDPDVPLDLGAIVAVVYERGGYATLIDYSQPPPPPLSAAESAWLDGYLHEKQLR